MRTSCVLALLMPLVFPAPVVLDRIAVVVGKHVIKASDVDREVRLTSFLNGQPLDLSAAARRKAAERLIDQRLIRDEIDVGGYGTPAPEEAAKLLSQFKASRFPRAGQFTAALERDGITEQQVRAQLLWQLTVLRFIEQRFRPGVLVTDEDVQNYYNQHQAELRKTSGPSSLEALRPKIQQILAGEQVNKQFFDWLDEKRKQTRVEFREDAFQ